MTSAIQFLSFRVFAVAAITSACFLTTACSKRMSGTYVSTRYDDYVLELKSDGSFYLRGSAGGLSGKYTVKDTELFLKAASGRAMKFTIRDNDTVVGDTGEVFLTSEGKAKRSKLSDSRSSQTSSSAGPRPIVLRGDALSKQLAADSGAFAREYAGKTIEIAGEIGTFGTLPGGSILASAIVSDQSRTIWIDCECDPTDAARGDALRGQRATITGIFDSVHQSTIKLRSCRFR